MKIHDSPNIDSSSPSPEEREAIRRLGRLLISTAVEPSLDWDALADQALCGVTLLDYGPPEHVRSPTLQPLEVVQTTDPLPLRAFGQDGPLHSVCDELASHLPSGKSWGFSLCYTRLPSRLDDFMELLNGLLHGPFDPSSASDLEAQLRTHVDVVWSGLQYAVFTDEMLRRISGGGSSQWGLGYLRALIDIDVMRGTVAAGSIMVDDDAELRDCYRELARRCRARGDLQRAALFSFTAVSTLPLATDVSSGSKFTRSFCLQRIMSEAAAYPGFSNSAQLLDELIAEFQDLLPEWRKLEARRIYEVERLSRRASEGLAVWREIHSLRFSEEGEVRSLDGRRQPGGLSAERRQYYMSMATDNAYR